MKHLARTYDRGRIPLYLQVATAIRRRIEEGRWRSGQKIPTLEEFEAEFQVARVTVRQAIDVLEQDGLVRRHQGKGTFVADNIRDTRWLRLGIRLSQMVETIEENVPHFIPVKDPPPVRLDPNDGRAADAYVFLRSVQYRDGEPFALASIHLKRSVYNLAPDEFRARTALTVLAALPGLDIARAHQTLVIGAADPEIAEYLRVPLNAPTAESHCAVTDRQGVAIYVAEIIYRGDCVKLDIDLLADTPVRQAEAVD